MTVSRVRNHARIARLIAYLLTVGVHGFSHAFEARDAHVHGPSCPSSEHNGHNDNDGCTVCQFLSLIGARPTEPARAPAIVRIVAAPALTSAPPEDVFPKPFISPLTYIHGAHPPRSPEIASTLHCPKSEGVLL